MHELERDAFDILGQVGAGDKDAIGNLVGIKFKQRSRIDIEVIDDHAIRLLRVDRQRHDNGQAATTGGIARGHMHDRRAMRDIEQLECALLAAQVEMEIEQARLLRADQAGKADQGLDIRQRIVCAILLEPVGRGEVLQAKAWCAVVAQRPLDALRTQGVTHAREVDQVPARVAGFPFALIRIMEIAVQQMPRELVIETQGVVADPAGSRRGEFVVHDRRKLGFDATLALGKLRRDAGDQAGLGMRQDIGRGLAIKHDRIADDLQIEVCADTGELRGPVAARIGTGGLVVVPEERGCGHGNRAGQGCAMLTPMRENLACAAQRGNNQLIHSHGERHGVDSRGQSDLDRSGNDRARYRSRFHPRNRHGGHRQGSAPACRRPGVRHPS